MKSEIKKGELVIVLKLSRVELLHLEAALDAFDDMPNDKSAARLGKYEGEYSAELANHLWDEIDSIRDKVGALT